MSLEALVPYYGCKRQMADTIIVQLGEHKAYWEPFCGSMAVLLSKPPCRYENVSDINGWLVNLALVIQDDKLSAKLFDRLTRTAFSQELYARSVLYLYATKDEVDEPSVDLAYHYFIVGWMGRNGFMGTVGELSTSFANRFTSVGGDPGVRFRNVVEKIPLWWQRLRAVTILKKNGLELIGRIEDKPGVAIYCDPPYFSKSESYRHDFAEKQHRELAERLTEFDNTRIVVSYYEHSALALSFSPSAGWRKIVCQSQANLSNNKVSENTRKEVLFVKN